MRLFPRAGPLGIAVFATALAVCAQVSEGDELFRRADLDGAAAAYQAAVDRDPRCARAFWGLSRIETMRFHRAEAREFASRAYQLDPRDPEIIAGYAEFTDPVSRVTLLANVVALTRRSDVRAAEDALGQLQVERRLAGIRPGRVVSPEARYDIPISPFQPVGATPAGVIVSVSINGGRPLRLLLDSGARGITIASRHAQGLGLETVSNSLIGGFGRQESVSAQVMLARSVRMQSLELADVLVDVLPRALSEGADGVIGLNVFADFEIHLSPRASRLRLLPLPEQAVAAGTSAALQLRHLLLVRAAVNGGRDGLFLVDTGSAFTTLARELAPNSAEAVPMRGAGGAVPGAYRISPVELRIGTAVLFDHTPLSMDLNVLSRKHGVAISGVLGYSALSWFDLTVNYRDGVIALSTPSKRAGNRDQASLR